MSLARAGDPATLGALLVGAAHAVLSAGRAVLRDLRLPGPIRWPRTPLILLHAVIFVLATGVAYCAAVSAPHFESLVPSLHEVTITLWTAVIAAVGGAYVLQLSRGRTNDSMELARRSARKIPSRLVPLAVDLSGAHGADPQLVTATMIAENLQRPPWFRSVERIKGLVLRAGTYGIMQVSHDRPISDEESLRIAVETRLRGVTVKGPDGNVDYGALNTFARSWNGDSTFPQLIWACYEVAGHRLATLGSDRKMSQRGCLSASDVRTSQAVGLSADMRDR